MFLRFKNLYLSLFTFVSKHIATRSLSFMGFSLYAEFSFQNIEYSNPERHSGGAPQMGYTVFALLNYCLSALFVLEVLPAEFLQ